MKLRPSSVKALCHPFLFLFHFRTFHSVSLNLNFYIGYKEIKKHFSTPSETFKLSRIPEKRNLKKTNFSIRQTTFEAKSAQRFRCSSSIGWDLIRLNCRDCLVSSQRATTAPIYFHSTIKEPRWTDNSYLAGGQWAYSVSQVSAWIALQFHSRNEEPAMSYDDQSEMKGIEKRESALAWFSKNF